MYMLLLYTYVFVSCVLYFEVVVQTAGTGYRNGRLRTRSFKLLFVQCETPSSTTTTPPFGSEGIRRDRSRSLHTPIVFGATRASRRVLRAYNYVFANVRGALRYREIETALG